MIINHFKKKGTVKYQLENTNIISLTLKYFITWRYQHNIESVEYKLAMLYVCKTKTARTDVASS